MRFLDMERAILIRRSATVFAFAGTLVLGTAELAAADDTVPTTTGQTLSIRACADGPAEQASAATGVVKLSPGTALIESVFVRMNGGDPEWVRLDSTGHFRSSTPWPSDWSRIEISATARATDGSSATSGCTLTRAGMVAEQTPPIRTLPNTGPSGRHALAPIGLAMVMLGSTLAWTNRRHRTRT